MNNVGDIGLGLQLDGKGYKKQIKQFGDYGSNQLQSSFSSTFKSIGKLAVAAFSIKAITDFSASCLKLGSDLTEVQNVVDVAFPAMNSQVNDFAKNAITQFGLSETIAKRYAGTFGAMSKAFGFTEQASADMAMELTGLAGDVASFYNLSPDEAYTKLKSVFTGETESLKDLGVVMTQSALDQYALAKGYAKTTAQMSEQEKVELRMGFVTKQLSTASGDFMRTQDSWANQTRVLTLQWESFKASIGKGLIALFAPIVKGVNWVLSNLQPLADSFASLMEMLTGTKSSSGGALATTAGEITSATEGTDTLSEGLTGAGKSGEKAAKKINKAFAKVDTINKLSFDTGDSDPVESGTGGISNGSVASAVNFPEAGKQGTAFQGVLDGLISEFKRLSDIFKFGFEIGFGESAQGIERIKIGLSSIGTSIVSIFTDPKVMGAALSWIEYTTLALGSFVGSVASIGVSIGELFVGSIAKYLETNTKFIKDRLISIFDISKDSNIILGAFYAVIADIAGIFTSPQAINTGSDFIRIIYNSMMLQVDGFLRVANSIIHGITDPIIKNKDVIKQSIEQLLKPIGEITSRIGDKINSINLSGLDGVFSKIKSSISDVVNIIGTLWGLGFQPVIESILAGIIALWDGGLSALIDNVAIFITNTISGLLSIWDNAINPLIGLLTTTFLPIFTTVFNEILAVAIPIVSKIMDYINIFMGELNSLMVLLSEQVFPIFKVVFEGLSSVVSGFWEFVSPIFNWFIVLLGDVVSFVLDLLLPQMVMAFKTIVSIIQDIVDPITQVFEGVIEMFKGVIDFVTGIFTGDWSKAWEGIKGIFSGVWNSLSGIVETVWKTITALFSKGGEIFSGVVDGIASAFKAIVNCLITGINQVISFPFNKINGLLNAIRSFDIPVIGAVFEGLWDENPLPVPNIPKLAQGGYVGANQPQLAMIGDNKRYGEIVAPENKMIDMIDTALRMQTNSGNVDGIDKVIALILQLIDAVKGMVLKVDIDMKKLSILLENAQKERDMIGG